MGQRQRKRVRDRGGEKEKRWSERCGESEVQKMGGRGERASERARLGIGGRSREWGREGAEWRAILPAPRLSLSFLSCFSGAGAEQSAQGGEGRGHEGDKSGLNDQKQDERPSSLPWACSSTVYPPFSPGLLQSPLPPPP